MHLECILIFSSSKVVQTIPLVESSQEAKPPLQDFPTTLERFSHSLSTSHQERSRSSSPAQAPHSPQLMGSAWLLGDLQELSQER